MRYSSGGKIVEKIWVAYEATEDCRSDCDGLMQKPVAFADADDAKEYARLRLEDWEQERTRKYESIFLQPLDSSGHVIIVPMMLVDSAKSAISMVKSARQEAIDTAKADNQMSCMMCGKSFDARLGCAVGRHRADAPTRHVCRECVNSFSPNAIDLQYAQEIEQGTRNG